MILPDILPPFIPYALTLALFGGFVIWNGGIVLGTCILFAFKPCVLVV